MKTIATFILILLISLSCDSKRIKMVSTSMEGTLKKGDVRWLSPVKKITGNQIIAFRINDKYQKEQIWVFRVVGVPGDVIEIKQGKLYVNETLFKEPENLKFSYNVNTRGRLNLKSFKGYEYTVYGLDKYLFHLTEKQKERLNKNSFITSVESNIQMQNVYQKEVFKSDTINKWNRDNYDPIEIPSNNNDKRYFVLGDNRHNAADSRYIGFILESDVVGMIEDQ